MAELPERQILADREVADHEVDVEADAAEEGGEAGMVISLAPRTMPRPFVAVVVDHRLRAVLLDDSAVLRTDLVEGLLPCDPLPLAAAALADLRFIG